MPASSPWDRIDRPTFHCAWLAPSLLYVFQVSIACARASFTCSRIIVPHLPLQARLFLTLKASPSSGIDPVPVQLNFGICGSELSPAIFSADETIVSPIFFFCITMTALPSLLFRVPILTFPPWCVMAVSTGKPAIVQPFDMPAGLPVNTTRKHCWAHTQVQKMLPRKT